MQERYRALITTYGPLCIECWRPWVEPSPDCPHKINDVHPLAPLPADYLAGIRPSLPGPEILP